MRFDGTRVNWIGRSSVVSDSVAIASTGDSKQKVTDAAASSDHILCGMFAEWRQRMTNPPLMTVLVNMRKRSTISIFREYTNALASTLPKSSGKPRVLVQPLA